MIVREIFDWFQTVGEFGQPIFQVGKFLQIFINRRLVEIEIFREKRASLTGEIFERKKSFAD